MKWPPGPRRCRNFFYGPLENKKTAHRTVFLLCGSCLFNEDSSEIGFVARAQTLVGECYRGRLNAAQTQLIAESTGDSYLAIVRYGAAGYQDRYGGRPGIDAIGGGADDPVDLYR